MRHLISGADWDIAGEATVVPKAAAAAPVRRNALRFTKYPPRLQPILLA
jgi:hypothetical protein